MKTHICFGLLVLWMGLIPGQNLESVTIVFLDGSVIDQRMILPESEEKLYHQLTIESEQEPTIFFPTDIKGFMWKGRTFLSFQSTSAKKKPFYFAELMEEGKISLLKSNPVPAETIYLFKKAEEPTFHELTLETPDVAQSDRVELSYENGQARVSVKGRQMNHNSFFKKYFADCPILRSKWVGEMYSIGDLEEMIRVYNMCGE